MGPVAISAIRVDYPKRWFSVGSAIVLIGTAVMLYLAIDAKEEFSRWFWVACAALVGGYLSALLVPPLFTSHQAGQKGLRLKMGLLMNMTIPYDNITDVREAALNLGGIRVGIGVKFVPSKGLVYVTSSFGALLAVSLKEPVDMGRFVQRSVHTIVLSVVDREGFVAIVKDRAGLEDF